MPDGPTIDVLIPVEARLADRLADPALRARAGEVVSAMLREAAVERLDAAIAALKADAHARGLTDEIVDEELAAYKTERMARRSPAAG
jgi:uncharacterized protein YdaT